MYRVTRLGEDVAVPMAGAASASARQRNDMNRLRFHTQTFPELAGVGAGFVVVAHCGSWRDGLATSVRAEIPRLERELRKRFMRRIPVPEAAPPPSGEKDV